MLCLLSAADRVPKNHPLRAVKRFTDVVLSDLSSTFNEMYSAIGRASIPPESLLKASLLMSLYSIRSERAFCEQLNYNLLYRWFLDMDMASESFNPSTFSKNRERLLSHAVTEKFFRRVVQRIEEAGMMSNEHFTVDGTLIEAAASLKSFKAKEQAAEDRKDDPPDDKGNPTVDFHGEKRSNKTHASTTDSDARLMRKGKNKEAKMSYSAHALMENRNGLLVDLRTDLATGRAEREAAIQMLDQLPRRKPRITLGADAGYDTRDFVSACRERKITPHVAPHRKSRSATDGRTQRHVGYATSQRIRKRVEEIFGWAKTVGNARKTRYRGLRRVEQWMYMVGSAYNLLRSCKLMGYAVV